ncbi:MAG: 1,4-dihydroxy-6-naphthoate synthase [Bacteroidales bacterium]
MSKLSLSISSCPNDTFMFADFVEQYAHEIDLRIKDIETLNTLAMHEKSDITKLSYHVWLKLRDKYDLLNSGAAMGENCGPILVSKHKAYPDEVADMSIAIPGEMTTANLLLAIFYPGVKTKKTTVFSDIEEAVLDGEVDAGLIIHESRFTYKDKGLKKIVDLGELWESETGLPTPLGGIAIHKRVPEAKKHEIDQALHQSIKKAFAQPESAMPFVRKHAQEMDDAVMKKHIDLYVNKYSLGEDEAVRKSIERLQEEAEEKGIV